MARACMHGLAAQSKSARCAVCIRSLAAFTFPCVTWRSGEEGWTQVDSNENRVFPLDQELTEHLAHGAGTSILDLAVEPRGRDLQGAGLRPESFRGASLGFGGFFLAILGRGRGFEGAQKAR